MASLFPLLPPVELTARALRGSGLALGALVEWRLRAARRSPLLANAALLPALFGPGLLVAAVHIVPPLVRPFGAPVVAEIIESDARKLGTALHDRRDRFIGAFPSRLDGDRRYNRGEQPVEDTDLSGRTILIHPDHKTLFVETPPRAYLACLKRLEDGHLGHPLLNPHGVDGLGLVRIVTSGIGAGGFSAGGSTLSSQLVQQLIRPKAPGDGQIAKLRRKGEEVFWTVPILYGHAPNDARFDQYLARHLPHLQYMQQERGTVWGIEAAAQVLYGRPAESLDPARLFILAGAIRRPLLFPMAHDSQGRMIDKSGLARKYWDLAIGRARVCADDSGVLPDPADRIAAKATLKDLARTLPTPQADPVIAALGRERYGARWPERARDPFRRASIFAHYAMAGLKAEFLDALGSDWSREVAAVRMSIDIADERRFAPRFRREVRAWLAGRADLNPWYRGWATYVPPAPEPVAAMPEVIAAVADSEGRLVRYYSSLDGAPYFGSQRDAAQRYLPAQEDRQQASVGKIGNALVLLRAGADTPASRRAYAISDTAAVEAFAAAADPERRLARDVLQRLHWSEAASRDGLGRPLDPAHAFATGLVSASPRTQHWGAVAITRALAADWRPAPPPSLIDRVRLVDLAAGRLAPPLRRIADPYGGADGLSTIDPAALIPPNRREAATLLLSAPVCAGGTLRKLKQWCAPDRASFVWGKTGTMDISAAYSRATGTGHTGVTLRVSIVGGIQLADGRAFSFYLSVGGVDTRHPLTIGRPGSRGLEASALTPLIDLMLRDLEVPQAGRSDDV